MQNPIIFAMKTFGKMMLFTVILPTTLTAQSLWLDRSQDKSLTLEFLKPNFKGDDELSTLSGAYFLSFRVKSGSNTHFVVEVPFAVAEYSAEPHPFHRDRSGSTVGNPYLGFEGGKANSPIFMEFGVRLPLTSDEETEAANTGLDSDLYRLEAFMPAGFAFSGMMNFKQQSGNLHVHLRSGGVVILAFQTVVLDYGARIGYDIDALRLEAGASGRYAIPWGHSFGNTLGLQASFGLGNIRPGVHFKLPLDQDTKDMLDSIFGINISFSGS